MKIGVNHTITYEPLLDAGGDFILTASGEVIEIGVRNDFPQKISIRRPCQGYYLRWYYNGWHYWFFQPGRLSLTTEGEKYRTIGTRSVMMGSGQITREQTQAIRTIMNTREVYLLTVDGWKNIRIEPGSVVIYDNQINGSEIEFKTIIGSKQISITGFSPITDVPVVPIPDPGLCPMIIGTQIWMCKNYDTNFPGSKVYDNDEANRAIYGGLYTFAQIMSPGFLPAGWHVPSNDEWNTLITYAGGPGAAGGRLREASALGHWNLGIDGTDNYFMAIRGAGCFDGGFIEQLTNTRLRTSTAMYDPDKTWSVRFAYDSNAVTTSLNITDWDNFLPVRLIKDTPAPPLTTIFDIDGNEYHQVIIGSQIWTVENLRTTKYADGSVIPNIINNALWTADVMGAYCAYDNDPLNIPDYGLLYNWYAVDNAAGLAYFEDALGNPLAGWRAPTQVDYSSLAAYTGKLKESGLAHWNSPNTGATNEVGFTGLPGGFRDNSGAFGFIKGRGLHWSSTQFDATTAYWLILYYNLNSSGTPHDLKSEGFSVRCVKDV
jgi:uncharacterized protein (TIGR02145 family)